MHILYPLTDKLETFKGDVTGVVETTVVVATVVVATVVVATVVSLVSCVTFTECWVECFTSIVMSMISTDTCVKKHSIQTDNKSDNCYLCIT